MAKSVFKFAFQLIIVSFGSCVWATEELVITHAPDSIKFLSNDPVKSSFLGDMFSSMLGYTIRSNVDWNGLAEVSPWKRPEALVIFELSGFNNKIDLPLEGNKFLLENAGDLGFQYDLAAHRTNERYFGKRPVMLNLDLGNEIHESKIAQPLLMKNIPADPAQRLQLAQQNPELNEMIEESIFNVSAPSDAKLITELATLQEFMKALSSQKSVVRDGVPDIYWLKISGLEPILAVYGSESVQFQEALRLMRQMIAEVESNMRNIYDDNVVVSVIKSDTIPLSLGRQARRLLESTEKAPVMAEDYNRAEGADEMYPVVFIMFVFIGLLLVLSILGISIALWNMDPGRDSMIYRATSTRMKKD